MTEWSDQQKAIFDDATSGAGHTVIIARAGTGKTTTAVEALKHISPDVKILMTAFNREIANQLEKKTPENVGVMTLHGLGFRTLKMKLGKEIQLDKEKGEAIARRIVCGEEKMLPMHRVRVNAVKRAAAFAKATLAKTPEEIDEMLDDIDLDPPAGQLREDFTGDVISALKMAATMTATCDFDDMVWMPVALGFNPPQSDRVFVDECQDMNSAQLELVLRACRPGGRICAIGDPKQAIYGFRGANEAAMDDIISGLNAKTLSLTVSYRCAKSIVRACNVDCPDFQAAPGAPEGRVENVSGEESVLKYARPGDFVLSRTNAPLVRLCLRFIRSGKFAAIAGRNVGIRLLGLIERSKAENTDALLDWIEAWKEKEIARLTKKDRPTQSVEDCADCIRVICEVADGSIERVVRAVNGFFVDGDDGSRVILSTTHKAKGLERDRVIVLGDTYCRPRPKNGEWIVSTEEYSLRYVAFSRARSELFIVSGVR